MAETGLCPGCMRELERIATETPEQKTGGQKMSAPGRHSQKGQQADTARCPYCGFCPSEYQQNPRCLPPDTILAGKYLVGKVLGEGGFGITYIGFDLNMKTRVAIKEYFPVELVTRDTTRRTGSGDDAAGEGAASGSSAPGVSVSSSGGGSDRVISLSGEKSKTYQQGLKKYVDEARNVSQFADIPGIVSVKDFFYENNTAYIVMEYIEGISLKEYLKQKGGKVSEEEALAILRPVLEALEKVHAAGIVHRDISPDNIMLTFMRQGNVEQAGSSDSAPVPASAASATASAAVYGNISAVKLIDFGAARMTSKNDQKSLTIILKHGYAPEEQYRSHGEQGPWTDVYALCAVLYRMLTGKVPEPAMDRLFSDGLKSPEELGVKVSPAVSEAIMRGLTVKKEERIQSVRELMGALYKGKKLRRIKRAKRFSRPAFLAVFAVGILAAAALTAGVWCSETGEKASENREGKETEVYAALAAAEGSTQERGAMQEAGTGQENESAQEVGAEEELVLKEQEKELGEQIVFYRPERSIASTSQGHMLLCLPDGTVRARGTNRNGQCDVEDWTHVAAVCTGSTCSFGLRTDGTVLYAGPQDSGFQEAGQWTGIVDIQAGWDYVLGLKQDGTVLGVGTTERAQQILEKTSAWSDIVLIAGDTSRAAGLKKDGTVLLAFADQPPEIGTIDGWEDVKEIQFFGSYLLLGLCEDGRVKTAELEQTEASGLRGGEFSSLTEVEQLWGRGTSCIGVKKDGTVFCGSWTTDAVKEAVEEWKDMLAVANSYQDANSSILYGLKKDGTILEYVEYKGNAVPDEMKELQWIQVVREASDNLVARTKDGELLTCGLSNWLENDQLYSMENQISGMAGINAVLLENGEVRDISGQSGLSMEQAQQALELWSGSFQGIFSCAYAVLKEDGSVQFYLEGDFSRPELQEYAVAWESVKAAEQWKDVTRLAAPEEGRGIVYGLRNDGTVLIAVDGITKELSCDEKIMEICTGYFGDLLGITESGKVTVLSPNMEAEEKGMYQVEGWKNIMQLAMGESHTVGLQADGTVMAAGQNYAGQCDVEDWKDIVYIAAGRTCTLGITAAGDLKMAGSLY